MAHAPPRNPWDTHVLPSIFDTKATRRTHRHTTDFVGGSQPAMEANSRPIEIGRPPHAWRMRRHEIRGTLMCSHRYLTLKPRGAPIAIPRISWAALSQPWKRILAPLKSADLRTHGACAATKSVGHS